MPAFVQKLKDQYASFWKLTDLELSLQNKHTIFVLSAAGGASVRLEIGLSEAGIETVLSSAQLTKPDKKLFFAMLKEHCPDYAAEAAFNQGKSAFIIFPLEEWKVALKNRRGEG